MPWLWLIAAGICEILWAWGLKASDGLTRWKIAVPTIFFMLLSFVLLAVAMKKLPLGTAYAVWTGIGAVGGVIIGLLVFHESRDWVRLACVGLIIAGIIGLKLRTTG